MKFFFGRKIRTGFIFGILLLSLAGCAQEKPNDPVVSTTVKETSSNENENQSFASFLEEEPQTDPLQRIMQTDHVGKGTLSYRLVDTEVFGSLHDAGISESDVENILEFRKLDSILKIRVEVINEDVQEDSTLINCLSIHTKQELAEQKESMDFVSELIYFDLAPKDEASRVHDYFRYTLPEPGESMELTLAWVVPTELVKQNELYLTHTMMGLDSEIPPSIPLDLHNGG